MADSNIAEFNLQVMRAVGKLYAMHPVPVDLDASAVTTVEPKSVGAGSDIAQQFTSGTLKWLCDNQVVGGKLLESKPITGGFSAAIMKAQLTAHALRILQSTDTNTTTQPLGKAVVAANAGTDDREKRVISELLVHRLLGG